MNKKRRILVVDDDATLTRLLRLNLEGTGQYEVREESNGRHVMASALEFAPDLILLDVMLPERDGGDIAAELQTHSRLSRIPIVFLTAAVKKTEVTQNDGVIGGVPFLAKPVDLDELMECLNKHLDA